MAKGTLFSTLTIHWKIVVNYLFFIKYCYFYFCFKKYLSLVFQGEKLLQQHVINCKIYTKNTSKRRKSAISEVLDLQWLHKGLPNDVTSFGIHEGIRERSLFTGGGGPVQIGKSRRLKICPPSTTAHSKFAPPRKPYTEISPPP